MPQPQVFKSDLLGFFRIPGTQAWAGHVYRNALRIARISEFVVSEVFATDPTDGPNIGWIFSPEVCARNLVGGPR
jgi:hypothetical protein